MVCGSRSHHNLGGWSGLRVVIAESIPPPFISFGWQIGSELINESEINGNDSWKNVKCV